jgi:hypothetical protein
LSQSSFLPPDGNHTYEEEVFHKAGVGTNRPRVKRRIIRIRAVMASVNFSLAVASRRTEYFDDFRVLMLWVHSESMIPCAICQRATYNIAMALEPEERGKLAHGRIQFALPVRAKTRKQTFTPDGTPGLPCESNPGRR